MGPIKSKSTLERGLETGLHFVSRTCVAGAYNRLVDICRTGGWVDNLMERRYPGVYKKYGERWVYAPKTDLNGFSSIPEAIHRRIKLTDSCAEHFRNSCPQNSYMREIITQSLFTRAFRTGTCGPMSMLLVDFLWQKSQQFSVQSLEIYKCGLQDHAFVVVNREADSIISDPCTWGYTCICVDPWASMYFAATDWDSKNREGDLLGRFIFRLEPESCPYPFIGGEKRLEAASWLSYVADYFPLIAATGMTAEEVHEKNYKPLCEVIGRWEAEHRTAFQACLAELSRVEFKNHPAN